VVAQKLFKRCQQEHYAQQSPEDERPKALDSESGRRLGSGTLGLNSGVDSLTRRQLSEDGSSVSSLLDGSWRGQTRAGNAGISSLNNAAHHQHKPQLNPQIAQKESQDWTLRRPVEMDGKPVGSSQSPTVPRALSPKAKFSKPLLDQSDMANRGTKIRQAPSTEETKPAGSKANSAVVRNRVDFFHSVLAVGSAMAAGALREGSRGGGT